MSGSSRNEDGQQQKCPRLSMDTLSLSDLPDAVLLHILSFLPAKSLVATSLLSSKWHYLWTSILNLHLHESQFRGRRNQFVNFAERALVLRGGSTLVSFSLSCSVDKDAFRINTWITSAIRCNVEQLSLNFYHRDSFRRSSWFPCFLFRCQSLVKLDITYWKMVRVPSSMICLPRLKYLGLKSVEFRDTESIEKLLSQPILEELIIWDCIWGDIMAVNVNSPVLQRLAIRDYDEDNWSTERQVCFFGDNLKCFHYEGHLPPTLYCICGSTMQLREAGILVCVSGLEKVMDMNGGPCKRYCKLVNSLSRVQNLTLSDDAVKNCYQLLRHCPELQPTISVFECVTQLNLTGHGMLELGNAWLMMILNRCPRLEHLNVKAELGTGVIFNRTPVPSYFLTHLKKITIHRYYPEYNDHVDAIHLLLKRCLVLEEMVLNTENYGLISSQVMTVERELNKRPKASEKCRISVI